MIRALHVILSFPWQTFPEAVAAKNAGDEDGEPYQDGPHRIEEDGLLTEALVFHPQVSDDHLSNCIQPSATEIQRNVALSQEDFPIWRSSKYQKFVKRDSSVRNAQS